MGIFNKSVNLTNDNETKIPFYKKFTKNQKLKNEIEKLQRTNLVLHDFIERLKYKIQHLTKSNQELLNEKFNLEKQLKQMEDLQKRKDDTFAMFIHDVKNPAAAIKAFAELLNDYQLSFNEQKEAFNSLVAASDKIINYSTDISKAIIYESASYKLELQKANIEAILRNCCSNNFAKALKKNQTIQINIQPDLPMISVDVDKIEEAFDNLIDNAIKYTKDSKTITVSAARYDTHKLQVEIADQGVGMSYIDIQKAFQKGVKLSAKPTGNESSTGLGLWIVKKIIDDHKGLIKIESELGKGTKFTITFPIK